MDHDCTLTLNLTLTLTEAQTLALTLARNLTRPRRQVYHVHDIERGRQPGTRHGAGRGARRGTAVARACRGAHQYVKRGSNPALAAGPGPRQARYVTPATSHALHGRASPWTGSAIVPHLSSLTEVVGYVETKAAGVVWLATARARPKRLIDRGWPELGAA